jgi:amidase
VNRRSFVARTAGLAAAPALSRLGPFADQGPTFPLEGLTITQLREMLESRRTTTRQLVDQYTARIQWLDETGPRLGHVLEVNPDARDLAAELDSERRNRRLKGPLHGIPVLIKDNIATADRMETTAGSLALLGVRPPRDAFIARKLREAGSEGRSIARKSVTVMARRDCAAAETGRSAISIAAARQDIGSSVSLVGQARGLP